MKNAVITGGAGFIGSHLAEELFKRGYRVTILDNLYSGKKENIKALLKHGADKGRVQFIQDSVTNLPLLPTLLQDVDFVFHLAAIASVPYSIQNPLAVHEVNLTGTLNVLEAARIKKVSKVIFISSSAVYGDTPTLPQTEDILPAPESPYAVTKLAAEHYCRVFREAYGLDTVSLRYFNVYGPRQDPNSQYAAVIPKFISLALEGKAPVIFGSGEQTRDFVFVKDAVNAAILAAESEAAGVYNIATGKAVTVNELTRLILDNVCKDLAPLHQEIRTGDILHSVADISRAGSFGYRPKYSLKEGLRITAGYFLERVKI
jgi:UDP-glucose 4-epimerase